MFGILLNLLNTIRSLYRNHNFTLLVGISLTVDEKQLTAIHEPIMKRNGGVLRRVYFSNPLSKNNNKG
jgi:hypothetical protein